MFNRVKSYLQKRFSTSQVPLAVDNTDDTSERVAVAAAAATKPVAAAYYPSWASYSRTPESLDFSKFDILFYGASGRVVSL
jgi:hypothetical protein